MVGVLRGGTEDILSISYFPKMKHVSVNVASHFSWYFKDPLFWLSMLVCLLCELLIPPSDIHPYMSQGHKPVSGL